MVEAARRVGVRDWVSAAGAGAAPAALLHLGTSLPGVILAWRGLPATERTLALAVRSELFRTGVLMTLAIAMLGGAAALAARLVWLALRREPTRGRLVVSSLALLSVVGLRAVAARPALFSEWLWSRGGMLADLQVLVAERLGPNVLDGLLAFALAALLALIGRRNRDWLRGHRRVTLLTFTALALGVLATNQRWPHRYRAQRPAVIVLAADSLRPDHFSSEGYPRPTTPNLDAFRSSAVWYADEFVPIASTTASWSSLLTGLYPHHHGIRNLFPRDDQTNLHLPTLPQLLRSVGYRSAVVSDYAGETFSRMNFGFDEVDAPPATGAAILGERELFLHSPLAMALLSGSWGRRLFPVVDYLPANADPEALADRVERMLSHLEDGGEPFLLVAFFSVTHAPFAAPMPEGRQFAPREYEGPSRYAYDLQQLSDLTRLGERPSDGEVEEVRALYDGALRSFDRAAGRLLQRLAGDGLLDQSVVVVTGDHGESLFEPGTTTEHGKWFRGGVAANRTALMIRAPGQPPGTCAGLASGVDLTPTLLELLGLPPLPRTDGLALVRPPPPDRAVFAESTLNLGGPATRPPGSIPYPDLLTLLSEEPSGAVALRRRYEDLTDTAKLRAMRQGDWELVYEPTPDAAEWRLFNVREDPFGERDLSAAEALRLAKMKPLLLDFLRADPLRWVDTREHVVPWMEE